jgi:hypothetical protein
MRVNAVCLSIFLRSMRFFARSLSSAMPVAVVTRVG